MNRLLPILVLVLLPSTAAAQQTACGWEESFEDCWERVTQSELEEAKNEASASTVAEVVDQPSGVETGGKSLDSNKKSFLPLLSLSGLLGEPMSSEDNEGLVVFDLNFLLGGHRGKNGQFQAIVNTQPRLASVWEMKLPEEGRGEAVSDLEKELADTSDVELAFSWALNSKSKGRDFKNYRERFEALWSASLDKRPPVESGAAQLGQANKALATLECTTASEETAEDGTVTTTTSRETAASLIDDDLLASSAARVEDAVRTILRCQLETKPGAQTDAPEPTEILAQAALLEAEARETARQIRNLIESAIDEEREAVAALNKTFEEDGLQHFAKLVDNQPQLIGSLRGKFRNKLVGADEYSVEVKYEWAQTNLNAALPGDCSDLSVTNTARAASCLENYAAFAKKNGTAIDKSWRFSASLEAAIVEDLSLMPSDLGLDSEMPLSVEGTEKVVVSVGSSRYMKMGSDDVAVDSVARWENFTGDPMRNNRWTASLTLTRKVNGFTIPIGIVWANKGEYLNDVDERLSAHLGLRFDLFGKKE